MSAQKFRISWTFMQKFAMTLTVDEARAVFTPDPSAVNQDADRARQQLAVTATIEELRDLLQKNPTVLDDAMCSVEDDEVEHVRRLDSIEIVG
ncbi:hypothetical protein SacmaDRAFT_4152 [Saccharomonospora marina XMU15]|uniref:Uncharacterized protein n=1 Tax=Saccharomonospora marina XMU15 TaxID=882083 RepID=H5X5Z1_9PSEU|nr:hypothetical protein [Saccharomonospora marina]EHR52345.1 hypothetical protein SacmaDRAFT_4152 [Saccharomonospora marina XMU15]